EHAAFAKRSGQSYPLFMDSAPFDPALVRAHRARAAAAFEDVLARRVADDLAARLAGVNRSFETTLVIGAARPFAAAVAAQPDLGERLGAVLNMDIAPAFVAPPLGIVANSEALPFADGALGA